MKKTLTLLWPVLLLIAACKKDNDTNNPGDDTPQITDLVLHGDTLHIIGHFGPTSTVSLRHVIINDQPVPEEKIVKSEEEKIEVKIEKKAPDEKKVQVEVDGRKSNVKIINIPSIPVTRLVQVDFLQVKEPSSFLYIYGSFSPDPGANRRSISIYQGVNDDIITNVSNIISWTAKLIVCQIPASGKGSVGKVVVKVDNDTSSRNLYRYDVELEHKRPQGGASGTLAELINFHIKIRGDGASPRAQIQLQDLQTNVHADSYADWEGSGHGSSSYNNIDGCATINVDWTTAKGAIAVKPNNEIVLKNKAWISWVKHRTDGFDVKIKFEAYEVVPSKIVSTSCSGHTNTMEKKETISFDCFEDKVIPLRFGADAIIKPNEITKTGLSSTAGLAWDSSEFPLHFMTAYVKWSHAYGWLNY